MFLVKDITEDLLQFRDSTYYSYTSQQCYICFQNSKHFFKINHVIILTGNYLPKHFRSIVLPILRHPV